MLHEASRTGILLNILWLRALFYGVDMSQHLLWHECSNLEADETACFIYLCWRKLRTSTSFIAEWVPTFMRHSILKLTYWRHCWWNYTTTWGDSRRLAQTASIYARTHWVMSFQHARIPAEVCRAFDTPSAVTWFLLDVVVGQTSCPQVVVVTTRKIAGIYSGRTSYRITLLPKSG